MILAAFLFSSYNSTTRKSNRREHPDRPTNFTTKSAARLLRLCRTLLCLAEHAHQRNPEHKWTNASAGKSCIDKKTLEMNRGCVVDLIQLEQRSILTAILAAARRDCVMYLVCIHRPQMGGYKELLSRCQSLFQKPVNHHS